MSEGLYRRRIKSRLEKETGWIVKTHVNGTIDVYPPAGLTPLEAKDEVVRRVRDYGYEPTVESSRDAKGRVCICFHTPETVQQEGQGGHGFRRAPS
jgi:hypothetical protein